MDERCFCGQRVCKSNSRECLGAERHRQQPLRRDPPRGRVPRRLLPTYHPWWQLGGHMLVSTYYTLKIRKNENEKNKIF